MNEQIPLVVHEGDMARAERMNKRLWILCIVLILIIIATNGAWLWYESQWEVTKTTITQEAESDGDSDVIMNNGGDLNYGGESTADN